MKKLRVSPALLALCAAVLLFVGAFFLGRASALGEARITVQRAAPASDALQIDGSGEGGSASIPPREKSCSRFPASAKRRRTGSSATAIPTAAFPLSSSCWMWRASARRCSSSCAGS